MTTTAITPLRQRMIEDMNARKADARIADCLRALSVGGMSDPIECDEGYQVLQRIA